MFRSFQIKLSHKILSSKSALRLFLKATAKKLLSAVQFGIILSALWYYSQCILVLFPVHFGIILQAALEKARQLSNMPFIPFCGFIVRV